MSVFSLGSMHPMGVACYDDQQEITFIDVTKVDEKAEETRSGHYVADCTRHGRSTCYACAGSVGHCNVPNWESGCYSPVWKYYAD